MVEFYFDEIVKVDKIDSQVVYDKVSRINAKSEDGDFYLELDVHAELYPMIPGEKYRMVIADNLLMDGLTAQRYSSEEKLKSLADKFEYVVHGFLYKISEAEGKACVYISFGGLQLMLKGDPLKMYKYYLDQKLFLLMRKA